jgi:23S rRNA (adenine2503-C2)-methyltransferase
MRILSRLKVPTGDILIVEGSRVRLECLSLADYGQERNIKADFLGLTKPVRKFMNAPLLPLSKKWVATISTQYGCDMSCKFCNVPLVGPGINASTADMLNQVKCVLDLHPEVGYTERLNVHFARMGEPTLNYGNVIETAVSLQTSLKSRLGDSKIHPVLSTMLPNKLELGTLTWILNDWMEVKNRIYKGNAGLQFSISTTANDKRNYMFSSKSHSLSNISRIGERLLAPLGRKIALNFIATNMTQIDSRMLSSMFDTNKFMVKITPLHETDRARNNLIKQSRVYQFEEDLLDAGFDVLVFIPSKVEDLSKITCGNAILAKTMPECDFEVVR